METINWIRRAYKKLKGSAYYDKTQLPLVNKLVSFEKDQIEGKFDILSALLDSDPASIESVEAWEDYVKDVLSTIDVLVYPKTLETWPNSQIIFNTDDEPIRMEKAQYFIDIDVMGHILGVLWVLTM